MKYLLLLALLSNTLGAMDGAYDFEKARPLIKYRRNVYAVMTGKDIMMDAATWYAAKKAERKSRLDALCDQIDIMIAAHESVAQWKKQKKTVRFTLPVNSGPQNNTQGT